MSAEQEVVTEIKGRPGEVYVGLDTWVSPFRLRRHTSDIRRLISHLPLITEAEDMEHDKQMPFWLSRLPDSDAAIASFGKSLKEIGKFHQAQADAVGAYVSQREVTA